MVRPDDALLRELEAMAVGLDELDARARAGDEPYADRELHAQVEAKRRRVLLELEVAGVLAPANLDPLAWLALCELNFRAAERPRAGRLFVRLEGTFHQLDFRTEVGPEPHLYRALPA